MEDNQQKNKPRTGLHKKISSIFDGVPVPRDGGTPQPAGTAGPGPDSPGIPQPGAALSAGSGTPATQQITATLHKLQPTKQNKVGYRTKGAGQTGWKRTWQKITNKLFGSKRGSGSERQKIMTVLIPVLFIVLIFVLINVLKSPARRATQSGEAKSGKAVAETVHKIDWKIPEPYAAGKRNPMRESPATSIEQSATTKGEPGNTAGLVVKGIVHSKDRPTAVIGTQIVHQGDVVGDATVVKINQDSVEFEMNNKKWTQKIER